MLKKYIETHVSFLLHPRDFKNADDDKVCLLNETFFILLI